MQARDELINALAKQRTLRTYNPENVTGLAGISWCCQPNQHRNGAMIHQFRAQAPSGARQALTANFSIPRHGLWQAYRLAVAWRIEHASPYMAEIPDPTRTFEHFIHHYLSHLENAESAPLQDEMLARLDALQSDPTTPDYIQNVASHFVSQSRPLRCLSGG
jgi:hypothetical protein